MVDGAPLAFGRGGEKHLLDDLRDGAGVRLDCAGERVTPERSEPHHPLLGALVRLERQGRAIDYDEAGSMEQKKKEGYF